VNESHETSPDDCHFASCGDKKCSDGETALTCPQDCPSYELGRELGNTHACTRKADGTLWCWGRNTYGQIGDGTSLTQRNSPVQVSGLAGVGEASLGGNYSCARTTDGSLWCWGYNAYGQLGDGTTTPRLSPVQVSGLAGVAEASGGLNHTCARKA